MNTQVSLFVCFPQNLMGLIWLVQMDMSFKINGVFIELN